MFYVDIPSKDCIGQDEAPWLALRTFDTKTQAVEWIRENIGWCDDSGNICLISGGETFRDEDVLAPVQELDSAHEELIEREAMRDELQRADRTDWEREHGRCLSREIQWVLGNIRQVKKKLEES